MAKPVGVATPEFEAPNIANKYTTPYSPSAPNPPTGSPPVLGYAAKVPLVTQPYSPQYTPDSPIYNPPAATAPGLTPSQLSGFVDDLIPLTTATPVTPGDLGGDLLPISPRDFDGDDLLGDFAF